MIDLSLTKQIDLLNNGFESQASVLINVTGRLTGEQTVKLREDIEVVARYFEEKYGKEEKDLDFEEFLNKN